MKTIWLVTFAAIPALLTSGCGTILNLRSGSPEVYGGIQKDVEFVMTPAAGGGNATYEGGIGAAAALLIVAADATLSLVADTLTLPVVIRKRHIDPDKDDKITHDPSKMRQPPVQEDKP